MADVKKISYTEIRQNVIQIGIWYVEQFEKDNSFFIECLVTMKTVRQIMIMVYHALIADKQILPLEQWEYELKQTLWSDANDFAKYRLTKEGCIELSKCLYVLKVL